MPRQKVLESAPPTALLASAVRYPGNSVARIYQPHQDWQAEAWRFYDIIGELRFAANWMANMLSRAHLFTGTRTRTGVEPTTDPKAAATLAALFGGPEGQSQMLSALGLHLTVAGEAYLVGRKVDGTDVWDVLGSQEVKNRGARWYLDYGTGDRQIPLADSDVVIRIWRPHPRRRIMADSPVRPLLPILTELEFLTRHIFAQVTSRLAGAGILTLPQGMTFPAPPDSVNLPVGATAADQFMAVLQDAMLTPIQDPSDSSALVPIVLTVPDEMVGKADLMHFWTDLDQHAIEMRNEAIRRFAQGMDMPPEVVLGLARSGAAANHWTAWQIDEASIKVHLEPLLELITQALTTGYLIPLTENPVDVIGYETTDLKLRPDRSKEALELYDRGELTGEALRQENGFKKNDAPGPDELTTWLLRKVASGSTTPEQVEAALRALGVPLLGGPAQGPSTAERPTPSLKGHPPPRGAPNRGRPSPELVAACEAMVFRALERAGNRLKNNLPAKLPAIAAADIYLTLKPSRVDGLLDDAWTCVPRLVEGKGDPQQVIPALDAYCHTLLSECRPHNRDQMIEFLSLPYVTAAVS
jgi:hypothetical protein